MVTSINEGTAAGRGEVAPTDRTTTVTPENPTPPTNVSCHGQTPPVLNTLTQDDMQAGAAGDPTIFAVAVSGEEHEGSGAEDKVTIDYTTSVVDTIMTSVNNEEYVNIDPSINASHPSSPDYVEPGP